MAVTATEYDTKTDTAFFREITQVFRNHPEAAKKYALASLALEKMLGIDTSRKIAVSTREGDRVITEFHDRDKQPPVIRAQICLKYELRGQELKCVHWMEAPE
ncbi:hypothetical protein [Streptomyces sp. NPDC000983]|uniref:hypothetical protein n=1 Tax=Streptomyces sp. NPDC000983 TaxID=3154373 RepID=UPI0033196C00